MDPQATYQIPEQPEATGRFLVTLRQNEPDAGERQLAQKAGVRKLARSTDFKQNTSPVPADYSDGGFVLEEIGIAVVEAEPEAMSRLAADAGERDSAILAVEPEYIMYATGGCGQAASSAADAHVPTEFLRGYREAVNHLYERLTSDAGEAAAVADRRCYADSDQATWGLQATRVLESRCSGRGIRIAVLDTGMDLGHPDFVGRSITAQSFIPGERPEDEHGHGTHCIGTACGPKSPPSGVRRYGIAHNCDIFVGKVLSNSGSGADAGILAGINWAVVNHCQVISMSLGARICETTTAYEVAGQRALAAGSLIVAAAGNGSERSRGRVFCVERPANSRSIMAVGAVDRCLRIADFSAQSRGVDGGEVDIAAPGVNVYSAWPRSRGHHVISGTSMATPHVAGIAALLAEAFQARGFQLWQLLTAHAGRLPLPSIDVGSGLAIAPGC